MTSEEKQALAAYVATLDRHEHAKLLKRASQLRKHSTPRTGKVRQHAGFALDDEEDDAPARRKPSPSMDEFLWRIIQAEMVVPATPTGRTGLVVGVSRQSAQVLLDGETKDCKIDPDVSARADSLAVGDDAIVESRGEHLMIMGAKERRTKLSRPDVGNANRERVIAANIDTVVVVVSVVSPPLHPRILDRYLIAIQRGGCRAAIVVNKLDLLREDDRETELSKLDPYVSLGVSVMPCTAMNREGIPELRENLSGQLAAFVGHSGVGKSSLINALKPDLNLKVGDVSAGYGRGTHTTTSSSLIDLGDLRVIDTPGIRSFGLWKLTKEDLPWYFPEFATVGPCKFSDCTHTHEPRCRVKEAVNEGLIKEARYDNYLRIMETL